MHRYYELEVALQGIQPRIWRRLLIRADATFAQLHEAIQESFGWEECHLWEFRRSLDEGLPIAGLPGGDDWGRTTPDAERVTLGAYFGGADAADACEYVYDFGDNWVHDVRWVGVRSQDARFERRLLDGERAGPPEDCGGTSGYERLAQFVETGVDPYDDDPEELAAWLGDWRPDAFDVAAARTTFDR